jgi:hypothetical protein
MASQSQLEKNPFATSWKWPVEEIFEKKSEGFYSTSRAAFNHC